MLVSIIIIIIINVLPGALSYRPHFVTREKEIHCNAAASSLLPSKLCLCRALIKRVITRALLLLLYYILNKTMDAYMQCTAQRGAHYRSYEFYNPNRFESLSWLRKINAKQNGMRPCIGWKRPEFDLGTRLLCNVRNNLCLPSLRGPRQRTTFYKLQRNGWNLLP